MLCVGSPADPAFSRVELCVATFAGEDGWLCLFYDCVFVFLCFVFAFVCVCLCVSVCVSGPNLLGG